MIASTRSRFHFPVSLGVALVCFYGSLIRADDRPLNGHNFRLPDGFEIELVATSPLVERPITADFDEQGRLYVADSSGSNEKVETQVVERTHRIVRLEDTDQDGRFDQKVVFADKMMLPEGTLWYDGSLYVSAPPSIWKLTDTDDDGVADERSEWFQGKTLTFCANDLHGPYLGLDGWIYWCKGAFAEQTYPQLPRADPSGARTIGTSATSEPRQLVTKAAHIFRRRADGTGLIENVMTGGMDNPVDVVFMPGGERIFTTTFLQNPGGGLRDGLIHAVYGGVYGKVHDVTNFHPRTGDLMPPLVHMGAAAPCGLTRYESNVFGDEFRDNLFACQFNMHKISRHILEPEGATFKSTDTDFVVSSNLDFHPTDILEDADGSLIICDTGGWYTLCCPTSQLTKPDIFGAIYRVRRTAARHVSDPRGRKLDWSHPNAAELMARLSDPRPAVVSRVMQVLAKLDQNGVPELTKLIETSDNDDARRNAVWTLTRIDHEQARSAARKAVLDRCETVRLAALHSISLWRDSKALPLLADCLEDSSDAIRRVAAEALGRLENDTVVKQLLQSAGHSSTDRILQHSINYALIEIGSPVDLTKVPTRNLTPMIERIAMIANDQMPGGRVAPRQVVPWLTSKEPLLKQTALWLVGRHSDWGDALAEYLKKQLQTTELTIDDRSDLIRQLAQFSGSAAVVQMLAENALPARDGNSVAATQIVLEAMRESGLKKMPPEWLAALTGMIVHADPALLPTTLSVLRAIPFADAENLLMAGLLRIADDHAFPSTMRVDALAAMPAESHSASREQLKLLTANLRDDVGVGTRSAAVEALLRSKRDPSLLAALVESIPHVGPLELGRLLSAFEQCDDEGIGLKLVDSLNQSTVLTSLRVDAVKPKLAKFPPSVQLRAEDLYSAINIEAGRQKQKLDELMATLSEADIRRGQTVFNGQKAACSACHAIGYLGGNIGPDLSKIGKIRTERDLLEAIVFPSVSFVRSFEPVLVLTSSGKSYNGLIRRETPEEITLVTGAKEELQIARSDIDEMKPSTVSIMPAGLDTQLTKEQLADLIAFLKSKQ